MKYYSKHHIMQTEDTTIQEICFSKENVLETRTTGVKSAGFSIQQI